MAVQTKVYYKPSLGRLVFRKPHTSRKSDAVMNINEQFAKIKVAAKAHEELVKAGYCTKTIKYKGGKKVEDYVCPIKLMRSKMREILKSELKSVR